MRVDSKPEKYIYDYNPKTKRFVRLIQYPGVDASFSEVRKLKPSQMQSCDVDGGFIQLRNHSLERRGVTGNNGKWILRFSPGSEDIDLAWQLLIDQFEGGLLYQVKVSALNDKFPDQVLCIYTPDKNDLKDVVRVYDLLAYDALVDTDLSYMTDEQTLERNRTGVYAVTYTHGDVPAMRKIIAIMDLLLNTHFELHGGGSKFEGKVYPKSAANTLKKLKKLQRGNFSSEKCRTIFDEISNELKLKTNPTKWMFMIFGGRSVGTADTYRKILAILNEQSVLSDTSSFSQGVIQKLGKKGSFLS